MFGGMQGTKTSGTLA